MQPLAGVADERRQAPLDVEMHVLGLDRPLERARADLVADEGEAALDVGEVRSSDNPAGGEHPGVGERALDVEFGEPSIERHRRGITLDARIHRFGEAAGPGGVTLFLGGRHGGLKTFGQPGECPAGQRFRCFFLLGFYAMLGRRAIRPRAPSRPTLNARAR